VQIILDSRHLRAARIVTIMPRHLAVVGFAFVSLVIAPAAGLSSLASRQGVFDTEQGI
jgi:hypothetical protein